MGDEPFFAKFCAIASQRTAGFSPQGISNSVYALSLLHASDEIFSRAVLKEFTSRFDQFNAQGLSNSLTALASLGVQDCEFLQSVAGPLSRRLREFSAQGL